MIHRQNTLRFPAILAICIVLIPIALIGCGGSAGPDDNGNNGAGDSFALWKQQPDEQIVFMSKADSAHGELYLIDKQGQHHAVDQQQSVRE